MAGLKPAGALFTLASNVTLICIAAFQSRIRATGLPPIPAKDTYSFQGVLDQSALANGNLGLGGVVSRNRLPELAILQRCADGPASLGLALSRGPENAGRQIEKESREFASMSAMP